MSFEQIRSVIRAIVADAAGVLRETDRPELAVWVVRRGIEDRLSDADIIALLSADGVETREIDIRHARFGLGITLGTQALDEADWR
jgi:hypothetical protein